MSPGVSTGRIVAGRYRIVSPIGSGGHGVVDLAEDLLNGGRRVALKRLEGIVGAGDPEPAAAHLRWFRHPRWAEILDEGRLDAHGQFQVVRYVDGKSLDHVPLPLQTDEVLAFLEDGARVLGALHARGLIHYDVTPGNVLREVRPDGAVVFTLTDGGLANLGPVRGIARGSVMYMAPEVSDGQPHDHRVDLYALGLVAFRLATGRNPWEGGAGEVLGGRRREAAPSVRVHRPDADPRVERIVAALLERDPERRVADAQALLGMLTEAGRASAAQPLEGECYAGAAGGFLVGRDAEVARFRAACRTIVGGTVPGTGAEPAASVLGTPGAHHDNVLIVQGPSGSGGTRLTSEYAAIARAEGIALLSLSGRGGAADRRSPLRRLTDGITLLTGLADASAASGRADARPGREDLAAGDDVRMTERFVALCDRAAENAPLVLIIEDFPELPEASQEGVRVLCRHLLARSEHPDGRAPARLLVVVDHGPSEPAAFLLPDAADPRRPVQELAPLTAAQIGLLAGDRYAGLEPTQEDLEAVRTVTDGLPLLVLSVLSLPPERGDLARDHGLWIWNASRTATYDLDRNVSPAIRRAYDALSPAAREVADYLALLEVPVPEEYLRQLCTPAAIAEFAASPLASASHDAAQQRLVLGAVVIRDLVASARTTSIEDSVCRLCSACYTPDELLPELARLQLDLGRSGESLRLIARAAHNPGSAWIARARAIAVRAASSLSEVDSATAAAISRLLPSNAPLPALSTSLVASTRGSDAAALEVVANCARHFMGIRAFPQAETLLDQHLSSRSNELESRGRYTSLVVLRYRALASRNAPAPATRAARTEAALALRRLVSHRASGRSTISSEYYLARGRDLMNAGSFLRAVGAHERLLRNARVARARHLLVSGLNNAAVCHRNLGSAQQAERLLLRAIRVRLSLGDTAGATGQSHNLARVYQGVGRLREAVSLLHKSIGLSSRHGLSAPKSLALSVLSEIHDQLGNTSLALSTSLRAIASSRGGSTTTLLVHNLLNHAELTSAIGLGTLARASYSEARQLEEHPPTAPIPSGTRLTALLLRQSFGFPARIAPHAASARRRSFILRLLRITRDGEAASFQVVDDLRGDGDYSIARRQLALLARRQPSTKVAPGAAAALAELNSTRVRGPTRRLLLSLWLAKFRDEPRTEAASDGIQLVADVALRFGLLGLRSRALALAALEGVSRGDAGAVADRVSAIVDALETAGPAGYSGLWASRSMPSEVRDLVQTLRSHPIFGLGLDESQTDYRLVLHGVAHRLGRLSARSIGNDARRESTLRSVLEIARDSRRGRTPDELLAQVCDEAHRILRADSATIVLFEQSGQRSIVGRHRSASPAPLPSRTVIERAVSSRDAVLLHDVYGDSELMGRPSIVSMSLRSVLCAPLRRGAETFGVLYADRSDELGAFDRVDLEVVSLFAEQATAALESNRLFSDLQRSYAELKATQESLIRGERLRVMGEMTSGVAHEFNNLLTAILARVQLMEMGNLAPEIRDHLALIERASLDAAAVVRRLQGFTRNQRSANHRVVDLSEICADVVELLRPLWTTRRRNGKALISVRCRAQRGAFVSGDSTELREVVTNLLKNALDAVEAKGGSVTVEISVTDKIVEASVNDDGCGIPDDVLPRLFTPFVTTKGDRGTGLGLCLCQQILERHYSQLRVESAVGRGTSARFAIALAASAHTSSPAAETSGRAAVPHPRVLVVDDDPNVLGPLCDFLSKSGFVVTSAPSAKAALDLIPSAQPQVVVSDVAMPGMDGIELCSQIRRTHPQISVALMSGQASDVEISRLRNSGASALIPKPFTMRQVVEWIQSASATKSGHEAAEVDTVGLGVHD